MLADYFTKPLHGRLFHIFREVIMGWRYISTLDELAPHPSKERVGNMDECDTIKIQQGKIEKKPYAEIVSSPRRSTDQP